MKQANRIILIAIAVIAGLTATGLAKGPSIFAQGSHGTQSVSTTSHMDGTHPMPPPYLA
ncbi:MAG TPA: hypothetical protein VOA88_06740 [Candidatus Dormibacteraeota bacterium]|nr:hypothetical protein [Candidatus Dormibacteraeota bacterium]